MVSWSLEVILAYPGYFGTEAGFSVLQQHSGTDALPEAWQGFHAAAWRGSASLERAAAPGAVSTDRPCSVSSQREEMDFAAHPGHLFKSRFFWHP